MGPWLLQLLQRRQPEEGWPVVLAALASLQLVAVSASTAGWVSGLGWFLAVTMLLAYGAAFAASRILPHPGLGPAQKRRWIGPVALLGFGVLGLILVSLLVGWGEAPQVREDLAWYLVPLARVGLALAEMGQRLLQWVTDARGAGAAQDNAVFRWLLGLLTWAAVAWAGWWLFRRRRALPAMLPAGLLLALNAYFNWDARIWLPFYLAGTVVVMVLMQRYVQVSRWRQDGVDYSEDVQLEIVMGAVAIALLVFVFGALTPRVVFRPTANWFAGLVEEPVAQVEETGKRLFPGLRRAPGSLLATGGGPGSLPRSFLLGSAPQLTQEPVIRVTTDELQRLPVGFIPDELPHYYWRAYTADTYDGRGWRNGPAQELSLSAGEPWIERQQIGRRPVSQRVENLRSGDRAFYGAGEPVAVNRPYEALVRSDAGQPTEELVALVGNGRTYQVISLLPDVSESVLREAAAVYSPTVLSRYLELPPVSQRVLALTQEVIAAAAARADEPLTPYDQALALQDFLRGYRYELNVEPPPPGRELVDYFLFEGKAGYCDYFATAMIVMARSLGIPARLAVGYATGTYDPSTRSFLVRESQAHSWPELYFRGAGWVPFEPTPVRQVFPREQMDRLEHGLEADLAAQLQVLQEDEIVRRRVRWLVVLVIAVALALGVFIARRRRSPLGLVGMYSRLGRWGQRLGRGPRPGETANEFGRDLGTQLRQGRSPSTELAAHGVEDFVANFERAQYSAAREQPAREAKRIWTNLEPLLRRLWLMRWWPIR